MRKASVFFTFMFICTMFGSPVGRANGQCEDLSRAALMGETSQVKALIASGIDVNCSYTRSYVDDDSGETVTFTSRPLIDSAN